MDWLYHIYLSGHKPDCKLFSGFEFWNDGSRRRYFRFISFYVRVDPSFLFKGFRVKKADIINAPAAGAARSNPKPKGPIFKISLA